MKKKKLISYTGLAALSLSNFASADIIKSNASDFNIDDISDFSWNLVGGSQEGGVPNSLGFNFFKPFATDYESLYFIDFESSINLKDFTDNASSNSLEQVGTPITTSTRVGRRWLSDDNSFMFGVNLGFDTRPVSRSSSSDIDFNQLAAGIEIVKENLDINIYGLIPTGDTKKDLSTTNEMAALNTYGIDLGINLTDSLKSYVGYYHQSDIDGSEGSGVKGKLEYDITDNITLDTTYSHDDLFNSRVSAGFKISFGDAKKKKYSSPVIQSLTERVKNRKVRTHTKSKAIQAIQAIQAVEDVGDNVAATDTTATDTTAAVATERVCKTATTMENDLTRSTILSTYTRSFSVSSYSTFTVIEYQRVAYYRTTQVCQDAGGGNTTTDTNSRTVTSTTTNTNTYTYRNF